MKRLLLALGLVLVFIAVLAAVLLRGSHPAEVIARGRLAVGEGIAAIRGFGPWVFFVSMAVLPEPALAHGLENSEPLSHAWPDC